MVAIISIGVVVALAAATVAAAAVAAAAAAAAAAVAAQSTHARDEVGDGCLCHRIEVRALAILLLHVLVRQHCAHRQARAIAPHGAHRFELRSSPAPTVPLLRPVNELRVSVCGPGPLGEPGIHLHCEPRDL